MSLFKYIWGWLVWHIRAAWWYAGLVFRLYFAIGLDRNVHPGRENDMSKHFQCPYPRHYLMYRSGSKDA